MIAANQGLMTSYLDFEKPIAALDARISELRLTAQEGDLDIAQDIERLETKAARLLKATYAALTPAQKSLVARHPQRPHHGAGHQPVCRRRHSGRLRARRRVGRTRQQDRQRALPVGIAFFIDPLRAPYARQPIP